MNPKKWQKKYQYLLMAVVFLFVFFLTLNKSHASENTETKEPIKAKIVNNAAASTFKRCL